MPSKKGLNKYLINIAYKHSLANRLAENSHYILYSFTPALVKQDNNIRIITTPKTFKDILY